MSFFHLQLPASARFPRELGFRFSEGFGLSLWIFAPGSQPLGYISARITECRLSVIKSASHLQLGAAHITLTVEEAARVWNTFRIHGMRLERFSEIPCAGTPLLPPAKQATPTADPLGDDCGVKPGPYLGSGSLDADNCTLARALTAHEHY